LFLAPLFTQEQLEYNFHPKCPVPFTGKIDKNGEGGFSSLCNGCIHPAHQVNGKEPQIAIKELRDATIDTEKAITVGADALEKAYRLEVDVLDMVRDLDHKHLIKVVAAYKQFGKRHFMFQWADGGNLREFWHNSLSPTRTKEMVSWVLKQILGLAGAINKLHNYDPVKNCRHGDLKPENIKLMDVISWHSRTIIP